MRTLGYLFIIIGVFIARAVIAGRATHVTKDMSDGFLALVRGDTDAFGEVLTRKGDELTASTADLNKYNATAPNATNPTPNTGILAAALKRGTAAKGYRWTATGPDYYDCSGLMWRACQDVGVYNGPRFTTYDVSNIKNFSKVTTPVVNDLVVWPTSHMGVVSGDDQYYSARSRKSGIGYAKISAHPGKPVYLRAAVKST